MKLRRMEKLGLLQRQYHRSNPWCLNEQGLFIPHEYPNEVGSAPTNWGDVGFILSKRRVMVWWVHPRQIYARELKRLAWLEAGDGPEDDPFGDAVKSYKKVGSSRKKLVSFTLPQQSEEQQTYFEKFRESYYQLRRTGAPFEVKPSWKRVRLSWATGVDLIAPFHVVVSSDMAKVSDLARNLLLGKSSIQERFPEYVYSQADWLADQKTEFE